MNGKKYIDLQLALYVEQMKHGLTYKPKLQFLINDKRVAELSGFIHYKFDLIYNF